VKRFTEIVAEAPKKEKAIVIGVGRFNPPTTGHELLCKKVMDAASARQAEARYLRFQIAGYEEEPFGCQDQIGIPKEVLPQG
jgi:hypothetical protein